VHVQIAAQVGQRDQLGQAASLRRFDFAGCLTQLGWNIRQPDRRKDLLFAVAAQAYPVAAAKDAVLADVQPASDRAVANRDDVLFSAAVGVQTGAEVARRQHPEVDLVAAFDFCRDHALAAMKQLDEVRGRGERGGGGARVIARGDEVDITDRLFAAPNAAHELGCLHRFERAREVHQSAPDAFGPR
jgi:hypothetical protein